MKIGEKEDASTNTISRPNSRSPRGRDASRYARARWRAGWAGWRAGHGADRRAPDTGARSGSLAPVEADRQPAAWAGGRRRVGLCGWPDRAGRADTPAGGGAAGRAVRAAD